MRRAAIALVGLSAAVGSPAQMPSIENDRATLVAAKFAAADAEARAAALRTAATRAGTEAERARTEAAALALSVAAAEQDIRAARARIAVVAGLAEMQRGRIATREQPILHLLAALQTMARRPAALALSQPGTVDDLVHVRLLLSDMLPVVAARTAALRVELQRATRLHAEAEQAATALMRGRGLLAERRRALAVIEATAIRRSQRLADQAADEAQRALGLGAEARDIADRLQVRQDADVVLAALERLPDPLPRPDGGGALPRHAGAPRYLLGTQGDVVTGFGEVSPSGVRARGLTLATAPGASVVAGAAGRVLFAGPFRSYGRIVIVGHGGGWTTTVTGLGGVSVAAGDRIAKGATIGRAPSRDARITMEVRRGGLPVDVLALAQAG